MIAISAREEDVGHYLQSIMHTRKPVLSAAIQPATHPSTHKCQLALMPYRMYLLQSSTSHSSTSSTSRGSCEYAKQAAAAAAAPLDRNTWTVDAVTNKTQSPNRTHWPHP